MSLLDKLKDKKKQLQELKEKGRVRTEQMKAEKLRKQQSKVPEYGTIQYGLKYKQSVGELMKAAYQRRKHKGENK